MNHRTIAHACRLAAAALAMAGWAQAAGAQEWPQRQPIHLVLPSAPGGSSDPLGRLLAEEIGKRIGQSIVVVNRPGAGGNLGMAQVARARPDGYTLVMSWTGPLATNLALYKDVGYDPQKDFSPIGRIGCTPNVLAVTKATPAGNLKEFIDFAAANPGKVSYGTTGVGSSWHIAGEMLSRQAANSLTHIPYNSPGAAMADLVGGRLQAIFPVVPMTVPHVRSGEMKVLAVFSRQRSPVLPEVPTTVEQGHADLVSDTCFMLLAPRGVPEAALTTLNRSLNAVLGDAALKPKIEAMGIGVQPGPARAVSEYLATEIPRQAALVKASGAGPQ
jgi:tripartite-type tricarboxylate transporter receptor subunit TctC